MPRGMPRECVPWCGVGLPGQNHRERAGKWGKPSLDGGGAGSRSGVVSDLCAGQLGKHQDRSSIHLQPVVHLAHGGDCIRWRPLNGCRTPMTGSAPGTRSGSIWSWVWHSLRYGAAGWAVRPKVGAPQSRTRSSRPGDCASSCGRFPSARQRWRSRASCSA